MNKKDLILNILLFISQIIVFYYFFCYLFPFKEQLQMFQFTSQYLTETLKQAGGVAIYISEFLSQFYVVFLDRTYHFCSTFNFSGFIIIINTEKD
ncbi:MAG: DUF6057 family protein [Parabacteroides merdae]